MIRGVNQVGHPEHLTECFCLRILVPWCYKRSEVFFQRIDFTAKFSTDIVVVCDFPLCQDPGRSLQTSENLKSVFCHPHLF